MEKRVLIVDDHKAIRKLVRRCVKGIQQEIVVVEAEDGERALACLNESAFDLVVTDVSMPKRDGLDVLREIRTNPATRELKVIVLSAECRPSDIAKGLDLGASNYVVKPFRMTELIELLRFHLFGEDGQPGVMLIP